MARIELLAPAKDLHKAKIALLYGADAVYVGGKKFSLRARASNFGLEEIRELVNFAHQMQKKVFITCNIVFHEDDFEGIEEYLTALDEIGVDAIIVESLAIVKLVKSLGLKFECHLSTQMNSLNSATIALMKEYGLDRVVIGREASIEEIEAIMEKAVLDVEIFIHGGMCSNYSGRCTLSNRMALRDANRGGCAQSCRWKYAIFKGDEKISDEQVDFSMSAKDLKAIRFIERLVKAKVTSLKIEGRMKSDFYIAQVVRTYRKLIDLIEKGEEINDDLLEYFDSELAKAENREASDGFLSNNANEDRQLFGVNGAGVNHNYVAYVLDYNDGYALIEVRNHFTLNESLEVFGPDLDNSKFICEELIDEDGNMVMIANKPKQILKLKVPFALKKHYMVRKA